MRYNKINNKSMDQATISFLSFLFGAGFVTGIINFIMKIGGYSTKLDALKADVTEIKTDCKSIWQNINKHGSHIEGLMIHTKYGITNSPTIPNELGNKLLTNSGFYETYPNIKEKIYAILDTMKTNTLYDAEKNSFTALEKLGKEGVDLNKLKNHSVNNPDEPLELIYGVASWVIRDDYAKDRNIIE